MPTRPLQTLRVGDFLGLNDDLGAQIGETQSITLQNWYKKRRSLVRRKGQTSLGSAVSPDQNLNMLSWVRIGTSEYLTSVHNTNVTDWLASGATLPNGAGKFPSGGDCNAALVDGRQFIGNGKDQNQRFNGGGTGLAASFDGTTGSFLKNTNQAGIPTPLYSGADVTFAAWVYPTSTTGAQTICSIWDNTSGSQRSFNLRLQGTQFVFEVSNTVASLFSVTATSVTVAANQWYFVVARRRVSSTDLAIQVNGGTIHTASFTTTLNEPVTEFRVGCEFQGPSTGFAMWNGRIGPLGIWRTAAGSGGALSDSALTALYNGGRPLYYADLSASQLTGLGVWYDLTETSGTRDNANSAATTFDLQPQTTVGTAAGAGSQFAVAQAMVQKPTSGVTLGLGTAGFVYAQGLYSYKVSFLNSDGKYGEPNDTETTFNLTLNDSINVTNIPTCPAGQDCSGRVVWRKDPGATVYKQAFVLHDNTTTTQEDRTAAGSLGQTLVTGNTRFPPTKYFDVLGSRLVGAHCETSEGDLQTVYVSNNQEPWYCPASPDLDDPNQGTRATLQGPAAGEITGLKTHGGVVAVFTGAQGHLLIGNAASNFRLQKFSEHGCAAGRTIVSIRNLLIWLSVDGVYAWDGAQVTRISDDVRTTLDAISASDLGAAHAVTFEDKYFLFWPSGALYYDLQYHIWGSLTNNLWHASTSAPYVSTSRQRIWAALEGHSRVFQLETGATDNGTTITAVWVSKDWDCGLPNRDKRVHLLETKFRTSTGSAVILLFRGTGEQIQQLAHDTSVTDISGATVSRKLQSVVETARDEHFKVSISIASTATNVELLACGLMYSLAS